MDFTLTNTLGGRKELFQPLRPGQVTMYHCGPTVKEPVNVDKFRSFLLADILRRSFELDGLVVRQCMNITDVGHLNEFEEDAVEIAADRSGKQPWELVEEEEALFHRHRRELRILDAHFYPRARENIAEMLELVEDLLEADIAYKAGKNIYFDIRKARGFGKLLGKSLDEIAALDADRPSKPHPDKRHPLDIDLWRTDLLHRMHWQSPWGRGFPGWHIECVVMSRKHLGNTFDIHTGTQENLFPHHECEIAQAEAMDNLPLSRYWLHSAPVLIEGRPVSRANRNLLTVVGLLDSGVRGVDIRAGLLSRHYREPIEFTPDVLDEAAATIAALTAAHAALAAAPAEPPTPAAVAERLSSADREFRAALADDLDFPRALAVALAVCRDTTAGKLPASRAALDALERWDRVLGLL